MLVANTMTVATMNDNTNANSVKKLLNYAQGAIKVYGTISDDTVVTVGTVTTGINPDCYTAAANAKDIGIAFAAAQMPCRAVIGGTSYNGTPSSLTTENVGTSNNAACILIGDTSVTYSSKGAAIGILLGTIAVLPVQRKISRKKNGPLSNTTAYLGSVALTAGNNDPSTIGSKGFITMCIYAQTEGVFFGNNNLNAVNDPMLTVSTDDYNCLANCRVIDKVQRLVYPFALNEEDDEIPSVPGTGLIDPGYALSQSQNIDKYLDENMTAFKNITGSSTFIDPNQNIVETGNYNIVVTAYANGYALRINITIGLGL